MFVHGYELASQVASRMAIYDVARGQLWLYGCRNITRVWCYLYMDMSWQAKWQAKWLNMMWPEGNCGYMDVGISLECDDVCTWICEWLNMMWPEGHLWLYGCRLYGLKFDDVCTCMSWQTVWRKMWQYVSRGHLWCDVARWRATNIRLWMWTGQPL